MVYFVEDWVDVTESTFFDYRWLVNWEYRLFQLIDSLSRLVLSEYPNLTFDDDIELITFVTLPVQDLILGNFLQNHDLGELIV